MRIEHLRAGFDGKFRLKKHAPDETLGVSKEHAERLLVRHVSELQDLHELLYAENRRALLIVLQGMDAAGKDGAIKHVMSGVNPQGCAVTSFKQPTTLELAHDFLWRIHAAVPAKGSIGIFNRSQYEDVLIARVHNLVPKTVWRQRYGQIRGFEETLAENGVHILKFFLHISKRRQPIFRSAATGTTTRRRMKRQSRNARQSTRRGTLFHPTANGSGISQSRKSSSRRCSRCE
jgi:PPK2 family polyphosphate:nucleotide phosphotransferase